MRVLVVDNYDSFVYNIAQYLGELGAEPQVVRNDRVTAAEAASGGYGAVVISPGPGTPEQERHFGQCADIIRSAGPRVPLLGVCLGHQGIIHAFGGRVANAGCVRHGKTSMIRHAGDGLFEGVPDPFRATRYHSLVGEKTSIPDSLEVTATAADDGEVMAVRHKEHPIVGVQFHPESVMTEHGKKILENFLREARRHG